NAANNTGNLKIEIQELSVSPGDADWSVNACTLIAAPVTEVLSLPHMSDWSVSESLPWLLGSPASGNSSQNPVFSLDTSKLVTGSQEGTAAITAHDPYGVSYQKNVTVRAQLSQACNADLSIQASALPASPQVGEPITFSFQVHNSGPMTATHVELVDTLPKGVTFISSDPAAIIDTNDQGQTLVLFTLGDMAVGASWTGKIVVTAAQAGKLHNQADVSSSVFDATPADNTHLMDINITGPVSKFIKWFLPLLFRK
ncbi:MAG: DUF11 domain-containing protein, partial [Omnitrophica WOR_2 bacterium]